MIKKLKSGKTWKTVFAAVLIISIMSFALAGCSSGNSTNQAANSSSSSNQAANSRTNTSSSQSAVTGNVSKSAADTDGDGISDKVDEDPLKTDNLIKETNSTPLELKIKDARVEDNATADHLEISMTNTGKTTLTDFDIYYTITDKLDKTQESYYQALNGLSINSGETKTIHFDNKVSESGHYYGNMSGLYGTSKNGLTFAIQLHAKGFKPMEFKVEKAEGTAEVAD